MCRLSFPSKGPLLLVWLIWYTICHFSSETTRDEPFLVPVVNGFTTLLPERREFSKTNGRSIRTSNPFSTHSWNSQHNIQNRLRTSLTKSRLALMVSTHDPIYFSPFTDFSTSVAMLSMDMDRDQAEALAGPFFGLSLFPYLTFLWLLARPSNQCPKGVTIGFATCLLFVFLTIPAAIASQLLYGVSLADSDWLHGSAESLLTITNLVTVVAFRQSLTAEEQQMKDDQPAIMPLSATSWAPMTWLVVGLTVVAAATAVVPALSNPGVHTPYLNGFMDLPFPVSIWGANDEPDNALTIATWIIHISSLVCCA
jgi:hypothetical protein